MKMLKINPNKIETLDDKQREAVRARLDIVSGVDAAATWSRALFGDDSASELLMYPGALDDSDAEACRERWSRYAAAYRDLLEAVAS